VVHPPCALHRATSNSELEKIVVREDQEPSAGTFPETGRKQAGTCGHDIVDVSACQFSLPGSRWGGTSNGQWATGNWGSGKALPTAKQAREVDGGSSGHE
jgi:hypothetical protein